MGNEKEMQLGGMALYNGIILKSDTREVIVTQVNKDINIEAIKVEETKSYFKKLPIIRGIFSLMSSIYSGIPQLLNSIEVTVEKYTDIDLNETLKNNKNSFNFEIFMGIIISFIILLATIIILPTYISIRLSNISIIQIIIQCSIQLILFSIYLYAITLIPEIKIIFKYHGLEHKAINAYETGVNLKDKVETIEQVEKANKINRRCGSTYLMYYIFIYIIFSFLVVINFDGILLRTIINIVAVPFICGLAYEILILMKKVPQNLSFLLYPSLLIQHITTKEPDTEKLPLAFYALKAINVPNIYISVADYYNEFNSNNPNNKLEIREYLRIVANITKINEQILFLDMAKINLNVESQIRLEEALNEYTFNFVPLQYVLGTQKFYKEEYFVNRNVLIPRADSEILVECAIEYINSNNFKTMLDLCTGSGCIGISTVLNSKILQADLVDISDNALSVTRKNVEKYSLQIKCNLIKSNLFEKLIETNKKYDIIVCNPPYIKTDVIPTLSKYVQNEPIIALDGGKDGLKIYRDIFENAIFVLNDLAYIILEIGYDQKEDLINLIKENKCFEFIKCVKDISKNDRVIICRFHKT